MAAGTLTEIAGIGPATARDTEAAAGREPEYLTKLVEQAPAEPERTGLRAELRGDCHTHSDWSDGGSPIREMAEAARDLGHEWVALIDHSPRLTVANGLSPERLRQQLDIVGELNAELAPFRILTGIEVDILEDGRLDQTDELLDRLDVVVASVHSQLRMPAEQMTPRMITAVSNPLVDVLGHCTGRMIVGAGAAGAITTCSAGRRRSSTPAVFACREHGTAVEINCPPQPAGPARGPASSGGRAGLHLLDRHRCPRTGPA